jgi:hypothetical protein
MKVGFTEEGVMVSDASLTSLNFVIGDMGFFIAEMTIHPMHGKGALLSDGNKTYVMSKKEFQLMRIRTHIENQKVLGAWSIVKSGRWLSLHFHEELPTFPEKL